MNEVIRVIKKLYKGYIVIILSKNKYMCYEDDELILRCLINKKYIKLNNIRIILKKYSINYIIIDKDMNYKVNEIKLFENNNYYKYLSKYKKEEDIKSKIQYIINRIKKYSKNLEIVREVLNNYERI